MKIKYMYKYNYINNKSTLSPPEAGLLK